MPRNVAGEVDDEVLPVNCTLLVIGCLMTKVSCRLFAALCPVRIVAEFESDPDSSSGVWASMSMILRCRALVSKLDVMS